MVRGAIKGSCDFLLVVDEVLENAADFSDVELEGWDWLNGVEGEQYFDCIV